MSLSAGRIPRLVNALTCTNTAGPPPLGAMKPNPCSSFQAVIFPW